MSEEIKVPHPMFVVKCGDEIVGYVTTEQGHEAFVDSVLEHILTPADYKRYKARN